MFSPHPWGVGWDDSIARSLRLRGRRQGSRGLLLQPPPGQGGNRGGLLASGGPGLPPPPLPRSPLYFPGSLHPLGSAGEPRAPAREALADRDDPTSGEGTHASPVRSTRPQAGMLASAWARKGSLARCCLLTGHCPPSLISGSPPSFLCARGARGSKEPGWCRNSPAPKFPRGLSWLLPKSLLLVRLWRAASVIRVLRGSGCSSRHLGPTRVCGRFLFLYFYSFSLLANLLDLTFLSTPATASRA